MPDLRKIIGELVDALIRAVELDRSPKQDAARAALLAHVAAKDAEIERLTQALATAQVPDELRQLADAPGLESVEPFRSAASRWVRSRLDAQPAPVPARQDSEAVALLPCWWGGGNDYLKAAQVPEELRQTMASVDHLWAAPPSALWACFDFVRSLLASEPAPAQASPGDALPSCLACGDTGRILVTTRTSSFWGDCTCATLLDYIAAKDAEIERLRRSRK